MPEVRSVGIYSNSKLKRERLLFAASCIAEVFPGPKQDRVPKAKLFQMAARHGRTLSDCPDIFDSVEALRVYMQNHWKMIRYMLPKEHKFVPCYTNGATWGGGGGYHKGDAKMAQKQVIRDAKITDGVLRAANDFAEATISVFPRIEAQRRTLVSRQITRRR